jgi:hypothetical protein
VVEIQVQLTSATLACQTALLDLINACIQELKRCTTAVGTVSKIQMSLSFYADVWSSGFTLKEKNLGNFCDSAVLILHILP